MFGAPPAARVRGQLNLETRASSPAPIVLWAFGNMFVRLAQRHAAPPPAEAEQEHGPRDGGGDDGAPIHALADRLHALLAGAVTSAADAVSTPNIRHVSRPPAPLAVGQTFLVNMSVEGNFEAQVACQAGVSCCRPELVEATFFPRSSHPLVSQHPPLTPYMPISPYLKHFLFVKLFSFCFDYSPNGAT